MKLKVWPVNCGILSWWIVEGDGPGHIPSLSRAWNGDSAADRTGSHRSSVSGRKYEITRLFHVGSSLGSLVVDN